jgi:hypothetical protein
MEYEYVYLYWILNIMLESSYPLYVERIPYSPVAFWSPASSWCRRAGLMMLTHLLYAFMLESCSSALIRMSRVLFILWILCSRNFESVMRRILDFGDYDFMMSEILFRDDCLCLWLFWINHDVSLWTLCYLLNLFIKYCMWGLRVLHIWPPFVFQPLLTSSYVLFTFHNTSSHSLVHLACFHNASLMVWQQILSILKVMHSFLVLAF